MNALSLHFLLYWHVKYVIGNILTYFIVSSFHLRSYRSDLLSYNLDYIGVLPNDPVHLLTNYLVIKWTDMQYLNDILLIIKKQLF